jgi:hypothetical protein
VEYGPGNIVILFAVIYLHDVSTKNVLYIIKLLINNSGGKHKEKS